MKTSSKYFQVIFSLFEMEEGKHLGSNKPDVQIKQHSSEKKLFLLVTNIQFNRIQLLDKVFSYEF